MATTNSNGSAGRRPAALVAGAGTLAFTGAILAAGFGGAGDVRADALCDQMRAQYGPSWPCISVPTYTPPPTMNAPTTTPGAPGTSSGGAVIGGDAGPGPGTGNGTPIVGGPKPEPPDTSGSDQAEVEVQPVVSSTAPRESARTTERPAVSRVSRDEPDARQSDRALIDPAPSGDGAIPTPIWAIAGAAAVVAAGSRAGRRMGSGYTPVKANVEPYGGYELSLKSEGDYSPDTSHIKPRDVAALLRQCFNCYFPVEGAPREFPKVGDELPLVIEVAGVRQEAPVRVTQVYETDDDFSFEFVGLPGHFDGEGSTVRFHFWNDGEQLMLNVYATTTDAPVPDFLNKRAAEFVWGRFLGNIVAALAY